MYTCQFSIPLFSPYWSTTVPLSNWGPFLASTSKSPARASTSKTLLKSQPSPDGTVKISAEPRLACVMIPFARHHAFYIYSRILNNAFEKWRSIFLARGFFISPGDLTLCLQVLASELGPNSKAVLYLFLGPFSFIFLALLRIPEFVAYVNFAK